MTILYEFTINVPNPITIFIGATVFLVALTMMIVGYSEKEPIAGILTFIALFVIALVIVAFFRIDRKENYAIAKIETFTDYEKVNTENRVVQLLKDNVFLVEMKSKKNNDETSSN